MKASLAIAALTLAIAACKQEAAPPASSVVTAPTSIAAPTALAAKMPKTSVVKLHIEGMICGGCAEAAEAALKTVDGVTSATVSFEDRTATVVYDPEKVDQKVLITKLENVEMGGRKMPFRISILGEGAK